MPVNVRIILIVLLLIGLIWYRYSKRKASGKAGGIGMFGTPESQQQAAVTSTITGSEKDEGDGLPEPETVVPGIERKMIDVGEREVWYLEGGASQPIAALLLHGFAGDKEQWLAVMTKLLGRGLRVVAPDLPGCGQNDKDPEDDYDIMSQVKLMRAFAHRLGLKSAHLVGASMGGTVAAAFAYASSDFPRSLTLIEPFGLRLARKSELDEMLDNGRNPLIIAAPAAYDNLMGFLCAGPVADRLKRERAERLAADRQINMKIWRDVREGERAHLLDLLLPELKVRTLVIQGEKSKVVHPSIVDAIRGIMSNAQAVVIPECGHLPMLEHPVPTADHLAGFMLPAAGAPSAGAPGSPSSGDRPSSPA